MGRLLSAGQIVYDQIDLYDPAGSINRPTGVLPTAFTMKVFVNNVEAPWPLVDGTLVPDSSVAAGKIYFNEVGSGFYSIRFFPDRIGFWRLALRTVAYGVELIKEYDLVAAGAFSSSGPVGGLNADFVKQ